MRTKWRDAPLMGVSRGAILGRGILLSYGLVDEVVTAIPVIGAPLLRAALGLTYAQLGLLFAVAALSGFLFEPALSLWSGRHGQRWWILGALGALTVCFAALGLADTYGELLVLFACYYPAVGVAVGLAQVVVVDEAADATSIMTRWTLLAGIGDIVGPLAITAIAASHRGWHALAWLGAALWAGLLVATVRVPFAPTPSSRQGPEGGRRGSSGTWSLVLEALATPTLWRWAILAWIPTMIDELLLAFAALYLHDARHASEAEVGLLITATLVAAMAALALLDRVAVLKAMADQRPRRLLAVMAVGVLFGMVGFVTGTTPLAAGGGLLVVGFFGAGWYPIAQGQTFAQSPGRTVVVRALGSLGAPLEALLAAAVGFVAQRWGLTAAVACIATAPLLLLAALAGRRPISLGAPS